MTGILFDMPPTKRRVFDLIASYEGEPMQGPFEDWLPQVQDVVYATLANKEAEVGKSLTIDRVGSDRDHDVAGVSFIHIVAVCYDGVQ